MNNNIYFSFEKVSKTSFGTVVIIFNILISHINMIAWSRTLYIPLNCANVDSKHTCVSCYLTVTKTTSFNLSKNISYDMS